MQHIPPAKPIILPPQLLNEAQQDCVDKLEQALDQARKGRIFTVGIVACFKSGYASTIGGTDAGSLNLGCDSLKRKILDSVEGESEPKPSSIRRI
jgi:hypothetical protein